MEELPETQSQEDYIESSQEIEIRRPWGRLCACLNSMSSVDLYYDTTTFGRAPKCDIFIDRTEFPPINNISKEHFQIHRDSDDIVFITDLSKNGTFINGVKIGKANKYILYNGDVIALGLPRCRVYTFAYNINHDDFDYPNDMLQKYFISKKIGRGGFGEVRLAHEKRTFQKVAVKKICKARSNSSNSGHVSLPPKVKTEIEILKKFSHSFIIQMIEVYETDRDVFLILEYMPGGELTKKILSAIPFPENEVKHVFYQILEGMKYLHDHGVTHRDLKPENVLLYSDIQYPLVKITDFGLSKIMDESSMMDTECGTISYAAPEVLRKSERYNKKVDTWSAGVILFYMLSKTLPFLGSCRGEVAKNILAGKITWDSKMWRNISTPAKDLTGKMLTIKSENRISTEDIFRHEWIDKDRKMKYRVEVMETNDHVEVAPKRPRIEA